MRDEITMNSMKFTTIDTDCINREKKHKNIAASYMPMILPNRSYDVL
jgi:hypothetical protein